MARAVSSILKGLLFSGGAMDGNNGETGLVVAMITAVGRDNTNLVVRVNKTEVIY